MKTLCVSSALLCAWITATFAAPTPAPAARPNPPPRAHVAPAQQPAAATATIQGAATAKPGVTVQGSGTFQGSGDFNGQAITTKPDGSQQSTNVTGKLTVQGTATLGPPTKPETPAQFKVLTHPFMNGPPTLPPLAKGEFSIVKKKRNRILRLSMLTVPSEQDFGSPAPGPYCFPGEWLLLSQADYRLVLHSTNPTGPTDVTKHKVSIVKPPSLSKDATVTDGQLEVDFGGMVDAATPQDKPISFDLYASCRGLNPDYHPKDPLQPFLKLSGILNPDLTTGEYVVVSVAGSSDAYFASCGCPAECKCEFRKPADRQ